MESAFSRVMKLRCFLQVLTSVHITEATSCFSFLVMFPVWNIWWDWNIGSLLRIILYYCCINKVMLSNHTLVIWTSEKKSQILLTKAKLDQFFNKSTFLYIWEQTLGSIRCTTGNREWRFLYLLHQAKSCMEKILSNTVRLEQKVTWCFFYSKYTKYQVT